MEKTDNKQAALKVNYIRKQKEIAQFLTQTIDELVKAIKTDNITQFRDYLDDDPDLAHMVIDKMYYPLHVACECGRLEMVRELVEKHGVDVNARCRLTGYTPLMYACQVG